MLFSSRWLLRLAMPLLPTLLQPLFTRR